jgi:DNA polymerase-3 subunit alpha
MVSDGMTVSQWDKKVIEEIGLYKFDILGLKLLTIFDKTREWINKNYGINIPRRELFSKDLTDKKVYETINKGLYKGLFQFDAPSAKQVVMQVTPSNYEDIVACESICRPGVDF